MSNLIACNKPPNICSCGEFRSADSSNSSPVEVDFDPSGDSIATPQCCANVLCNCGQPYDTSNCGLACDRTGSRVLEPLTLKYVVSTLEGVQGAMCQINRKMSKTGRAVAQVARRLRSQGQKVQRLQNRLRAVEPKLNLCVQQQALAYSDAYPLTPPPCPGRCHPDLCASCPACQQPCRDPRASAACCRERYRSRSRPRHQDLPYLATHASLGCRRSCYAVPPPCVVQRRSSCKVSACAPVASSPSCAWAQPGSQCACAARGGESPCCCSCFCGGGGGCEAHFHSPLARRLFKMAHDGRAEDVWNLLVDGADVNCLNSSKWTPLHRASAQGHVCVVAMLLEWGARVDAQTAYGHSPLHLAAAHDCSGRCAEVLLRAGADANCATRAMQTPLHLAAQSGNAAALQALLRGGARTSACDDEGRTPYDLAKGSCRRLLRGCCRRPHKTTSCCADTLYAY